jgi:hypothetical protein
VASLRVRAVLDENGPEHLESVGHDARGEGKRRFIVEDESLHHGPTGPAGLLWPVGGEPALLPKDAMPQLHVGPRGAQTIAHFDCKPRRQLVAQELPHLILKLLLRRTEAQVHHNTPDERQLA